MERTLRLVGTGINGQSRSVDVMAIARPEGLGEIAYLGLSLAEAKQLLSQVQQAVVAAQADRHAMFRPDCQSCGRMYHAKGWRPHRIAADVLQYLLPIDVGKSPETLRRHTLHVGKQLNDAAAEKPPIAAAAITMSLDSTFLRKSWCATVLGRLKGWLLPGAANGRRSGWDRARPASAGARRLGRLSSAAR
jgi:hypothetical protein